jgi:signal-transduction protein with cAMP-binding, CBS, and nucleotidyltransferase domain
MKFRKAMIRNLHYFRDLNDEIINAIMYKLDVKRYPKGQIILKNGDTSDRIMFLRLGEINV